MKQKHSLAPWVICSNGDIVDADGHIVAFFVGPEKNVPYPSLVFEKRKANAKLIAASPQLLSALKNLRGIIIREALFSNVPPGIQDEVDAAIAKAEGR